MQNLYIIIPTYNEGNVTSLVESITQAVPALDEFSLFFIIIDDGSTTATTCTPIPLDNVTIRIQRLAKNAGPGAAFGEGFKLLPKDLGKNDFVLLIEGDGTSDSQLIPKMMNRLNEQPFPYDLVLASPYTYGGYLKSLSLTRRILSSLANESSRLILDLRGIWTLSSFYRLFRGSSVSELQSIYGASIIESGGFECMVELLLKCKRLGFDISEVASSVDQKFRTGKSKMKIMKTIRGYLAVWAIARKLPNL